jgi:hypothetical protein
VKKDKPSCTHCKKEGHDEAHCWSLHPELKPKKFGVKEERMLLLFKRTWDQIQVMKQSLQLQV